MTTSVEKWNNNKFCEFHGDVRYNTDECMHLKRQIEELIKAGKMSHVIKELKQGNGKDQPKETKKGETSRKDKPLAILIVQPWGCRSFNLYIDEFYGGKITISVQWDHRKAMSEENSSSLVNNSRNVKIPVPGGILTLWSSKIIPLECTMVFGPEA
ncbi:hypothetical protein Tco_0976311 [Tanacetum coccineum]|uniref:Reverse transcriptase domain-containing protein n=1 Tax=Tanacetum coccineum TaxID=301880 RepID=A0ABQ5EGU2_9ASTR